MATNAPTIKYSVGICKQVNQGDSIVIREKPVDGPPPSKNLTIANITCPRVQFRPQNNSAMTTQDERFAWEAREFLRKMIVGREVIYTENRMPKGGIVGDVYIGREPTIESNVAYMLVCEGYAEVRKISNPEAVAKNKLYQQLVEAENIAKANMKGRWNLESPVVPRTVCWNIPEPTQFLQSLQNQEVHAIVEYVRDACSMQVCLMPTLDNMYYSIMVSLAGIRSPSAKADEAQSENLIEQAKFFVETRLLQKDVKIRLISLTGTQNFIALVMHPRGDISEFLLSEGLASCLNWGLDALPPQLVASYQKLEQEAKDQRKNIWSSYKPPAPPSEAQLKLTKQRMANSGNQFTGIIVEVGLGDNVLVKCDNGQLRKFYLASLRPVRMNMEPQQAANADGAAPPPAHVKINKPLYDIPYMFEAREFLRKHIGKQVHVHVDYTLPKPENAGPTMEDRTCATIELTNSGPNLAQGLISRGLAQVVRYKRTGNDPRAKCYDLLVAAEEEAANKLVGWHSKGSAPVHKIMEITSNASKAALPMLQRTGKIHGVVEFVPTAGRFKVFIPQSNQLITLLLSGVDYARSGRTLPNGKFEEGDPLGEEATQFSRELCLQRNCDIEVEAVDKVGNFIGSLQVHSHFAVTGLLKPGDQAIKNLPKSGKTVSKDLSTILVLQGYATVNTMSRNTKSANFPCLLKAQNEAQAAKNGIWQNEKFLQQWHEQHASSQQQDEPETGASPLDQDDSAVSKTNVEPDQDEAKMAAAKKSRVASSKPAHLLQACVGDLTTDLAVRVYLQLSDDAPKLAEISRELNAKPPSAVECSSFKPQKGHLCAAKFSDDGQWYRAQVLNISQNVASILYVDYGNEEDVDVTGGHLGPLPGKLASIPLVTKQYRLSGVCMPQSMNDRYETAQAIVKIAGESAKVLMHADSQGPIACGKEDKKPVPLVSLFLPGSLEDVAESLLRAGCIYVDRARMPIDQRTRYEKAQNEARKQRLNIWRFGDCRPDD